MSLLFKKIFINLSEFIGNKLTPRVKRYILLTSLWSYFNHYQKEAIDKETLQKLNNVMRLANDSDCLYIPALLSPVIWKDSLGESIQDSFSKEPIKVSQGMYDKIMQSIPHWLRYDKPEVIKREIQNLVQRMVYIQNVSHL